MIPLTPPRWPQIGPSALLRRPWRGVWTEAGTIAADFAIAQDSVGGNHGTLTSFADNEAARSTDVPAAIGSGRSLLFASGEHVIFDTPFAAAPSAVSWCFWIKAVDTNIAVLGNDSATVGYVPLFYVTDESYVGSEVGISQVSFSFAPRTTGVWHHVAITVESTTTVRFYVDGTEIGSGNTLANGIAAIARIGLVGGGGTYPFIGRLDDLRRYAGVTLSQSQLAEIAAGGEATGQSPTNHWTFDEGA